MLPFQILWMWVRGLLSIGLLVLAGYLLYQWYDESQVIREVPVSASAVRIKQVLQYEPGMNRQTALLIGGIATALIALLGGPLLVRALYPRHSRAGEGPRHERSGEVHRIRAEDGTELHVEVLGKKDGPALLFSHGWGTDATEWFYARKELASDSGWCSGTSRGWGGQRGRPGMTTRWRTSRGICTRWCSSHPMRMAPGRSR